MIGRLDVRDMKKKINNKGFTLIELLAIIAITAIVLGIGTYGIVDLVTKSKEKGSLISETSIKKSASLYADEAGDSLWIDPGSGNYKYYCITIEELINKGIIKKNAKLPDNINKSNYISIKKDKFSLVKSEPVILGDNADVNSNDYKACVNKETEENNLYTISYNANGGSNAPGDQSKIENKSISLSSSKPTRTGYTFVNWNTKKDGSGTTYKAGASYNSNADLTLYAQWRINKVYIKLDANGGSVRGSTTNGTCSTSNNVINCSWNDSEVFHTINYGGSLDSAGLANYNNPEYLYITKDGYFAYDSETWICDSSSGCSTVGKTFDQDKAYKASEFCDASNGDCTVTLKVNWKKIDTTINDWRCHDKYSYFITYCDSDDMCEYTARAYKENGASYSERVYGKINRNNLNLSSCFVDNIDDYRCNSNGKYKITTCSVTTCIYTELNGNTMNPNNLYIVDRDTLKECVPDTKTMYVTSSNGVNCRYGAGTSYGIAVAYSCGAALTVNVNATNGWYYVTNDGCYSVGSALSSSKPSSCVGSSGGGTSGGCKKIVKCITSAGSDAQCRSKISSLGGSYAGYNGKGDCIGNFCRSSCPSGSVETGGFY